MADVELHINVSGAGKPEEVAKLVQTAMDMRATPTRTIIPTGYRCVECYKDDGSHETTCDFYTAP